MDQNFHKASVQYDQDMQDTDLVTVKHLNNFKLEFKQDLQRVNNEIKDQITGIRKFLTHILEEVKFSKSIVNGRPKTSLLPKQPFTTVEDFLQYETEIQNNEQKYLQLILEFELQTASCMQSFVKSIWRKLIEDGAAQFLCWKGTDKKKSVRSLSVTLALKEACVKKYGIETSNDFERCCIHHFQHAKGRFQKKLNYVPRKPTN